MTSFFITGTDTDIGKTFVTGGLSYALHKLGHNVGVYKPLQSGAIETKNGLLAPDIESIKKISSEIKTKNTYLLKGEVSPSLAAQMANIDVSFDKIKNDFNDFQKLNDITLVEGAGGLCAPANKNMLMGDLIKKLNIPAILVCGAYLGSINHTLLSIKYLESLNISIKGIVINNFPENTNDVAVLNMEKELKSFTSASIIGIINKKNEINNDILFNMFKDCANRLIS